MVRFRAAVADAQERFPTVGFSIDEDSMWLTIPVMEGFENEEVTDYLDAVNVVLEIHKFGSIGAFWIRRGGIRN